MAAASLVYWSGAALPRFKRREASSSLPRLTYGK
jgi:hypothetical protein